MEPSKTSSSSHITPLHRRGIQLANCSAVNIEDSPQNPLPTSTSSAKHISSKTRARVASRKKLSQRNTNRTSEGIFTTPAGTIYEIDSNGRITKQAEHYQDSVAASEMARPEQWNSQRITPDDLVCGPSYFPVHQHNQTVARVNYDRGTTCETARDIPAHPYDQSITYAHDSPSETGGAVANSSSAFKLWLQQQRDGISTSLVETFESTNTRNSGQTPVNATASEEMYEFEYGLLICPICNNVQTTCQIFPCNDLFPCYHCAIQLYLQEISLCPICQTQIFTIVKMDSYNIPIDYNHIYTSSGIQHIPDRSTSTPSTLNSPNTRAKTMNTDKGGTEQRRCDTKVHPADLSCCICLERSKNCVIHPCCHFCSCYECTFHLHEHDNAKCPICRKRISTITKVDLKPASSDSVLSTRLRTSKQAVSYPCFVCLSAEINCMISPCHHMCTCLDCAHKIYTRGNRQCPVCNEKISKSTKVYVM